jgi:hypothetical protein
LAGTGSTIRCCAYMRNLKDSRCWAKPVAAAISSSSNSRNSNSQRRPARSCTVSAAWRC